MPINETSNNNYASISSRLNGPPKKKIKFTNDDLVPILFGYLNTRLGKPKFEQIKILADSGASSTIVAKKFTEKLRLQSTSETAWSTMAGNFSTSSKCKLLFTLPELHDSAKIIENAYVAQNLGTYDMIMGRNTLRTLGININFSNNTVEWNGSQAPMKPPNCTVQTDFHIEDPPVIQAETNRMQRILDAKYSKTNLNDYVNSNTYSQLNDIEKAKLLECLRKHESLFDGTLGKWKGTSYKVELKPDAKPYHARPYGIPRAYEHTLRLEVERLCQAGVLRKINHSKWAAPTFIIPKKDKTVRFISDFRELNKRIRRKPYPIPHIQDLLLKLEGFQYATSLDLNMGYYHIELHPDSRKLCTIVLPWGKYEYIKLPMGLCNSPDIFQEK